MIQTDGGHDRVTRTCTRNSPASIAACDARRARAGFAGALRVLLLLASMAPLAALIGTAGAHASPALAAPAHAAPILGAPAAARSSLASPLAATGAQTAPPSALPTAEPSASQSVVTTGDPRTNGGGPGLVGSPFGVALGVIVLGVIAAGGTLLYTRLSRTE
jgi:hypothetical protein